MVFKQNKRPFGDDESCQLSFKKHAIQFDHSNQLSAYVEIVPFSKVPHKFCISAEEADERLAKSQAEEALHAIREPLSMPNIMDARLISDNMRSPSKICSLAWQKSMDPEEYVDSHSPSHTVGSPYPYESEEPTIPVTHLKEPVRSYLDYPPQRLIPVGPDHQVDVPEWSSCASSRTLDLGIGDREQRLPISCAYPMLTDAVDPERQGDGERRPMDATLCLTPTHVADLEREREREHRLMGTCVQSMPHFSLDGVILGRGRSDCCCPDRGSVRCVKLHIALRREKLMSELGKSMFIELGFEDMGEEVAEKWSEEEERVFSEVVYSNPASLNRNFWDYLSLALKMRSKKELVSYYFNVFVLRRRAAQNRWDPCIADSDDDEWRDGDEEVFGAEDDDDSVVDDDGDVEDHDDVDYDGDGHVDDDVDGGHVGEDEDDEDGDDDDDDDGHDHAGVDVEDGVGDDDVGAKHVNMMVRLEKKSLTDDGEHPYGGEGKGMADGMDDADVQDDSCMSYEGGHQHGEPMANASQQVVEVRDTNVEMGNFGGMMEPCDEKLWVAGFLNGPKKTIDFLSTNNMIREVFGDEGWDNDGSERDGSSIS
ncbi:hypothetical protein AMTRI_Chr10g510 [Amborella trichopoda]